MDFYTAILKKSASYWVALCLENGLVGQGTTQEDAIKQIKEAIASFQEVYESGKDIYSVPVSLEGLHELLAEKGGKIASKTFELKAINA